MEQPITILMSVPGASCLFSSTKFGCPEVDVGWYVTEVAGLSTLYKEQGVDKEP